MADGRRCLITSLALVTLRADRVNNTGARCEEFPRAMRRYRPRFRDEFTAERAGVGSVTPAPAALVTGPTRD